MGKIGNMKQLRFLTLSDENAEIAKNELIAWNDGWRVI